MGVSVCVWVNGCVRMCAYVWRRSFVPLFFSFPPSHMCETATRRRPPPNRTYVCMYVHPQEQMTERVLSYDPEKEVAVLFAYKGQVRPPSAGGVFVFVGRIQDSWGWGRVWVYVCGLFAAGVGRGGHVFTSFPPSRLRSKPLADSSPSPCLHLTKRNKHRWA